MKNFICSVVLICFFPMFLSAQALKVNSKGNVGIGTSTPAYKLDVAGPMAVQGNFILLGHSSEEVDIGLHIG